MKDKKECRHIWHLGGSGRGISLSQPLTHDTVAVFLYCPKCLVTHTLRYSCTVDRANLTAEQLQNFVNQQKEDIEYKSSISRLNDSISRLKKNLVQLGYSQDDISLIIEDCVDYDTRTIDDSRLKQKLKEEHKLQAFSLLSGILS